jgi:hypothetical protein
MGATCTFKGGVSEGSRQNSRAQVAAVSKETPPENLLNR